MSQFTLEQLRRFGLTPKTHLGQHFLIDDNILRVIEELAKLGADDVVYEPGVGVGVLTAHLAERVRHVHGVELDEQLRTAVDAMLEGRDNVNLIWGDAVAVRPADLDPQPTKLVSNLPYHVAGPIIAEALQHAPSIRTYCVMIQKEVGERLFAPVGSKAYGALSVLVQATSTKTGTHHVARSVFIPPPNVDSSLIAFERVSELLADEEVDAFASFVRGAFAHRRKTLSNNLGGHGRETVVAALGDVGLKPAARPQELSPAQFVTVWRTLTGAGA